MLLDLFFPKFCINCNSFGSYICNKCRKEISFLSIKEIKQIQPPDYIDTVISMVKYKSVVRKIVKTIKYKFLYSVFDELIQILPKQLLLDSLDNFDMHEFALQPIPLHKNKQKQRGFNQAKLLADMFSKTLHIPCSDLLERNIDTKPQALLSKIERKKNIENAFVYIKERNFFKDKILLIDDVFTTGATANEAAKALKCNGVKQVLLLTLALD